jgi:HEAT repeat protein
MGLALILLHTLYFALAQSGTDVARLIDRLHDKSSDVRRTAAESLGGLGPAASAAALDLVRLLRDTDPGVRQAAADALGRIGSAASAVIPDLIKLLGHPKADVRGAAAYALGGLGPAASAAIPDLIRLLHDPDKELQGLAAYALGRVGPAAAAAAPDLVRLMHDPEANLRWIATKALGGLGSAASAVIPDLIKLLGHPKAAVRGAAAESLGWFGPAASAAIPDLIRLLRDPDTGTRRAAAYALGRLGPRAKAAVPELARLLQDPEPDVQGAADAALGWFGPAASAAIPDLVKLLGHPEPDVRGAATRSLAHIAENVADKNKPDVMSRRHLEEALERLHNREDSRDDPRIIRITRAVDHLKALERASFIARVGEWLQAISFKNWKTWAVILAAGWLFFLFAVFLVEPLWLLRWNEVLKDQLSIKAKRSDVELSLGIPLGYVSLIRPLAYHRRVLDAWVRAHVEKCRENFEELPTVKDRMVHIPSPLKVDGSLGARFSAVTLRAHIGRSRHQCRWLIFGEGGVGKTSLACQMARWAMAPDKAHRLAPHLVLPILIEDELDNPATPAGLPRFTEAIRGKLQTLTGSPEPISPELLTNLLRRLRVLVIVDHFTEMSQATRDQIRFDAPDFPAAALIVTARTDATLGNLPKHTVEPIRIQGRRLSVFLDAYLNERKTLDGFRARELFDDEEYFEACKQLARMAGERDITVLLAKLYADQMVAAKESPDADELPKTIPDLMLRYLSELNRNGGVEENRVVHHDCKIIAWECLRPTYRPGLAERAAVMEALKGDGEDEQSVKARLDYLINRLRLIRVTGSAEDHIRFVLDPLAEYLAGLQVVEENQGRGRQQKWEAFLRRADEAPGAPEAIRSFLLAVRDCCLARSEELNIPAFVVEELGKRAGLAEEMARAGIAPLIEALGNKTPEIRQTAVKRLGGKGRAAIPALCGALRDEDVRVRREAVGSLMRIVQIGDSTGLPVPGLIGALADADAEVRWMAAATLA